MNEAGLHNRPANMGLRRIAFRSQCRPPDAQAAAAGLEPVGPKQSRSARV